VLYVLSNNQKTSEEISTNKESNAVRFTSLTTPTTTVIETNSMKSDYADNDNGTAVSTVLQHVLQYTSTISHTATHQWHMTTVETDVNKILVSSTDFDDSSTHSITSDGTKLYSNFMSKFVLFHSSL